MSEENNVPPLLGIDGDDKMDMTIEPAVHHMVAKIKFDKSIIDQINEEIDKESIPKAKTKGSQLVGQFRQDERSAQLEMDLTTEVGTQFKTILNSAGTSFLNNGYKKKSYADCYTVWSNQGDDQGGAGINVSNASYSCGISLKGIQEIVVNLF